MASWNGYPNNIVNVIIKSVLLKETWTNHVISNAEKDKIPTVFINTAYPAEKGGPLLNKFSKKLRRFTYQKTNLVCGCSATKISFFTNMTDNLNELSKSSIVYQFSCAGCEYS